MILSLKEKKNNDGFTLVEMIVVLIVLGILASAAIYGISAYIDMTRYNSNQQDAASIYQSAQATLTHMSENGTIEEWAKSIIGDKGLNNGAADGIGIPDGFDAYNPDYSGQPDNLFNQNFFQGFPGNAPDALPGESAHMRYAVTFIPGSNDAQSNCIRDLLTGDFSATNVFDGVMTIEFDVEKVLDSSGELRLDASVYSVFYDSKRTSWDNAAYDTTGPNAGIVPKRDETYRRNTSLVGYYTGKDGSAGVDSVYIPSDAEIKDIICTLRNGETLDLTWSAVSDSVPVTGKTDHIHYTFSLYDSDKDGDNKFCDLVVNENSLFTGIPDETLRSTDFYDLLKFDKSDFVNGKVVESAPYDNTALTFPIVYTKETVHDERMIEYTVYKASIRTTARVYVHKATSSSYSFDYNSEPLYKLQNSNNYYSFPLTISYEIYDVKGGLTISERLSYTLSLDAMMARNVIDTDSSNASAAGTLNYSFNRLINGSGTAIKLTNTGFPVNLYATMSIEGDDFGSLNSGYNYTGTLAPSGVINAERALDDPVYLTSDGSYWYRENAAIREHGKGYAVVNSYFGDLNGGSVGTHPELTSNEAVITSFRHLYNIRMLEGNSMSVDYSILRDLRWYDTRTAGKYVSDVVVYSIDPDNSSRLRGFSPVPVPEKASPQPYYGDILNVVSFPSIPALNKYSTLEAKDNTLADPSADDKTSVIYNIQMRIPSFYDSAFRYDKLDGYGMINRNYGVVINIRANAMTLVLNNIPDGSPDDSEAIRDAIKSMITGTVSSTDIAQFKGSSPIGGLIGVNNGIVGSDRSSTEDKHNTMQVSNCIVMSTVRIGGEWKLYRVSACGGIIGDNNGIGGNDTEVSVYGNLRATGNFAMAGWAYVGSVIGYSKSSVNAAITVDNTLDKDKATIGLGDGVSSLLYATSDAVGGAIGASDKNTHFLQDESKLTELSYTYRDGVLIPEEPSDPVYAIDVNLDEHSYILIKSTDPQKETYQHGIGGAIGRVKDYSGTILSVRVVNKGVIASSLNTAHVKNLGGAIGVIVGGTISRRADIVVDNNGSIGSVTGSIICDANGNITGGIDGYSHSTGGAVGRIDSFGSKNASIYIIVRNNGGIFGNSSPFNDQTGVGGAVGTIIRSNAILPVCRFYSENNGIIAGKLYQNVSGEASNKLGVGGTVGYIEFIPRNSSFYCLMGNGSSIYSNGNNAGGCIGSQVSIQSNAPNGALTSITARLSGNSSVRSTGHNAGGAIGNAGAIDVSTSIRTIVNGTADINAFSDAGGVCGRFRQDSGNSDSSISLVTADPSSVINIRCAQAPMAEPGEGNDNAGGLVGLVSNGNTTLGVTLSLPGQSGSDRLAVNIDCYDNAGGMIGQLKNSNNAIVSEMTVVIHPASHIYARHANAGGCIGMLNSNNDFDSPVTVKSGVALSSTPQIKADVENTGGVIGQCRGNKYINSIITMDASAIDIGNPGADNVGGCIGRLNSRVSATGCIAYTGNNSNISGLNNVGGVIGTADNVSDLSGQMIYSGNNARISGNGNNVGGVAGSLIKCTVRNNAVLIYSGEISLISGIDSVGGVAGAVSQSCSFNDNASFTFEGKSSNVLGNDNIGGIFGQTSSGNSSGNVKYLYQAEDACISGAGNIGGIMGMTYAFAENADICFAPVTKCIISGSGSTGGIAGCMIGRYTNNGTQGGFRRIPRLVLNNCTLEIKTSGFSGGIVGSSEASAWYCGGTIEINHDSVLLIQSTGTAAGGNLGNMVGGNMGQGAVVSITCNDRSSLKIYGVTAAGGCIGIVDKESANRNNTFDVKININDSGSSIDVNASGEGAGAGGIIGINNQLFGRDISGTTTLSFGNAKMKITASNGYSGGIIGINYGKLETNNHTYMLNVTLSDRDGCSDPSVLLSGFRNPGEDWIIGLRAAGSSDRKYKYSINGGAVYSMP